MICVKETNDLLRILKPLYEGKQMMIVHHRNNEDEDDDADVDVERIAYVSIVGEVFSILKSLLLLFDNKIRNGNHDNSSDNVAIKIMVIKAALEIQEQYGCGALVFIQLVCKLVNQCEEWNSFYGLPIPIIRERKLKDLQKSLLLSLSSNDNNYGKVDNITSILKGSLSLIGDELNLLFDGDERKSEVVRSILQQSSSLPDDVFFINSRTITPTLIFGAMVRIPFTYVGHKLLLKKSSLNNNNNNNNNGTRTRILLFSGELELKSVYDNTIDVLSMGSYKDLIHMEWEKLMSKLSLISNSSCNILLCNGVVGDVATQYFVKKGIYVIGRVPGKTLFLLASKLQISVISDILLLASSVNRDNENQYLGEISGFYEETTSNVLYIYTPKIKTLLIGMNGVKQNTLLFDGDDGDDGGKYSEKQEEDKESEGRRIIEFAKRRISCIKSGIDIISTIIQRAITITSTLINIDQVFA